MREMIAACIDSVFSARLYGAFPVSGGRVERPRPWAVIERDRPEKFGAVKLQVDNGDGVL